MPEYKKYYISGVEFDTQTYCADFIDVIKAQQQKISSLEAEVAQLRKEAQERLREKLEKEHKEALKASKPAQMPSVKKANKIIISDTPL
jgi:hypothetical protein